MKGLLQLWLLAIVFALGMGEAFGQSVWTKDARNPVLSGGASGTWNRFTTRQIWQCASPAARPERELGWP